MFRFLTKQHFIVNFVAAIALLAGLLLFVLWTLGYITRHGQFEKVPSVAGKTLAEATSMLEAKGFQVEVQDSVWDESLPPLSVIKQNPAADELVKAKRTVFLSVNRSAPPVIEMPNFVGLSFRNAELYLQQLGLKLGDTLRKPDIAKNAVLEQLYNDVPIRPGTKIYQGSSITLVLGSGIGDDETEVPQLIGLTYGQVKSMLQGMGLNVGALLIDSDVKDTANAYIYKQSPDIRELLPDGTYQRLKIRPGQSIDLWLGTTQIMPPTTDSAAAKLPETDGENQ